jgi:hypothetical protein
MPSTLRESGRPFSAAIARRDPNGEYRGICFAHRRYDGQNEWEMSHPTS